MYPFPQVLPSWRLWIHTLRRKEGRADRIGRAAPGGRAESDKARLRDVPTAHQLQVSALFIAGAMAAAKDFRVRTEAGRPPCGDQWPD